MSEMFHSAVPIGPHDPWLRGADAFVEAVRMVLETRPGTLPWRPEYGCDLSSLVGQPASSERLNQARFRIEQALRTWVPGADVARCEVLVATDPHAGAAMDAAGLPVAERALARGGVMATLEVRLDIITPYGLLPVQALLQA
jgi:phage baseplate assembly protein W